jgi:ferredoxin
LKTHGEATITGAIKNYWGIIPGGLKAKFHLLGKNPTEFGEALADNYSWIVKNKKNRLTIYDLQRVMQGPMGPVSGPMKKWNLIMVGTDELALDLVALKIGKLNAEKYVPHLKNASERGLGISDLKEIEILGLTINEAKNLVPKFRVPGRRMTKFASFITGKIVYKVTKRVPKLKKKICKRCKQCYEICPANAIKIDENNYPNFLKRKCISCLCCLEICPQQAIKSKQRGFLGLFHSY